MINKIADSAAQAMAGVRDGATVLIGGFGTAGIPGELIDALIAQGYEIKLTPPEPAAAFFRSEAARMAQVVKNANVKID